MRGFLFRLGVLSFFIPQLSSCGYHVLQHEHLSPLGRALFTEGVCVDPISKDCQGLLTSALIRELSTRSIPLSYGTAGYRLHVKLINAVDENIGFTYAPGKLGDTPPKHFIVSNEGRISISAHVQLIHCRTGQIVIDRCISRESVSFDFQPDLGTEDFQQLSLGQYEMHSEAIKSAQKTLYTHLAEAIVQQVYYDLF